MTQINKYHFSDYLGMGKLSLYRSRRNFSKKVKGHPKKYAMPLKTKDIDTTLSYESSSDCDETKEGETSNSLKFDVHGTSNQDLLADPSSDSDGTNADNDDVPNNADIWRSEYARRCFETLKSVEFLTALISVLHQSGCLRDFMLLVTQLAEGTFSPMNIAFLLCLEHAKWQSLITTTQMRFRAVTKKFWLIVYRLLKGKGIRFFSGPKNWGQVVSKEAKLGQYDPKSAEINFAVPDERYLRCQDRRFGKLIQPGIMKDSLRILQDHPDVVLMADCKRLSKGLKGEHLGDIDLWSHEGPPTLGDKLQELEHHKRIISEGIEFLEDSDDLDLYMKLKLILKMSSLRIKDIREVLLKQMRRLSYLNGLSSDPNFKIAAKSACKAQIYECKVFVNKALALNLRICKCLAKLQGTEDHFHPENITLCNVHNVRRLHNTSYVGANCDLNVHTHLIKQGSEEWMDLRKSSHITGSTAYNALGFRGFKSVREHFKQFIYNKEPSPFPAEVQQRLNYGRVHEVRKMAMFHNIIIF